MAAKAKDHSGKHYIDAARDAGLRVTNGHGDHYKVYGPVDRGYMIIPAHAELGKGLECKVIKWLLKCGVVLAFASAVLAAIL